MNLIIETIKADMANRVRWPSAYPENLTYVRLYNECTKDNESPTNGDVVKTIERLVSDVEQEVGDLESATPAVHEMLNVFKNYLPDNMSDEQLIVTVDNIIAEVNAVGPDDVDQVLSVLEDHHYGAYDRVTATIIARQALAIEQE